MLSVSLSAGTFGSPDPASTVPEHPAGASTAPAPTAARACSGRRPARSGPTPARGERGAQQPFPPPPGRVAPGRRAGVQARRSHAYQVPAAPPRSAGAAGPTGTNPDLVSTFRDAALS
ncbi:hypothetical protein BX266_0969 [Streptomyces sp. TLI_171]|nr:hypothetical protein BX266_0969 [Streptomyces sp. TLI_171]